MPKLFPIRFLLALATLLALAPPLSSAQTDSFQKILDRTSQHTTEFLDQFSNVKCTEIVKQEKFRPDGKVEIAEQSTYDYLVILTNSGGDLSLNESRLPVKEEKVQRRMPVSMLLSNGFATLFLVFHPYYMNGFEFSDAGDETFDGHAVRKIFFKHIPNTRSIAALALRGREYPLEISGTAWVDPKTGDILRLEAGVGSTLEDIGMKTMQSSVRFSPVVFSKEQPVYWFPSEASIEVETPKQHWRNTHRFSTYKQFAVSTEEHVAQK